MNSEEEVVIKDLLHQNRFGGGSGRGFSFYNNAAKCGMREHLYEKKKLVSKDLGIVPSVTAEQAARKNAFWVGSAYHTFHEAWSKGVLTDPSLDFNEPLTDVSDIEGARLFRGWAQHWPQNFWGKIEAVEQHLPSTPEAKLAVHDIFGCEVTAKPDLVVYIDEADLARVQTRCPAISEPGYYIIDHKTADTPPDDRYFSSGYQALWYPHAWMLQYPDKPIVGLVYDVVYKHGRRKDKTMTLENFHAVFVSTPELNRLGALIGTVKQAQSNLCRATDEGLGNRAECFRYAYGGIDVCPFYANGCYNEIIDLSATNTTF